ncbi:MAG: Na(+)-translocating NADH-quinone reductase subunit C [Gammaproteobacteria bacterium]|nr:Na(+)-translocating NADH-quinone reductase subunit C [Gammaproteobacteria bacterium]
MANNDTIKKTLLVAVALCVVCSVIVSGAAVALKDAQVANKLDDRNRNILAAAGMLEEGVPIAELFARIDTKVVDLRTGKFTDAVAADNYNQRKAAKDPAVSDALSSAEDIAKIRRREHLALVYIVEEQGQLDKIILPIHGYALWSTLYGFIALESDGNTVAGLGFYEHKETPGLGGEVDNPRWKALWPGKQVYLDGQVALKLMKGVVDPDSPDADYQVDGLAGATLTSRGVSNLVQFWLGEGGFGPFIANLRAGKA